MDLFDGWEARIIDDFPSDHDRLYIRRYTGGNEAHMLIALDDHGGSQVSYEPGTLVAVDGSEFRGLWLPKGVAQAIAAAVNPGPSLAELARLEDALTVERRRVDSVLGTITSTSVRQPRP